MTVLDVNMPKFIHEDTLLFSGIVNDLFPTTDKSKPEYAILKEAILQTMQDNQTLGIVQIGE